jgi:hypothetical protein
MRGWSGVGMKVVYIDPLNCPITNVDVFSSKHFRYAYQKEYRFIWLPHSPKEVLDHIVIKVPAMKEYCYLANLGT